MLKTSISLKNFFIFNSTFCTSESDDVNKILFFYPEAVENNDKLKDVGFIEAIIKFTSSFSLDQTSSKDVLTMKTSKTMKFFYEPEKDFWIVLTINVPFERKEKDKKEYNEYYSDDAHESVFKKIIQRTYSHFRLFCNTFESNMIGEGIEEKLECLRSRLSTFYTKYLLTLNMNNADIIDSIECLQYKPVTHLIFFRIANFLNVITSMKNLKVKKAIFLYNQEVVYSSINPSDLYVVYEFLIDSLFPKFQRRSNQTVLENDRTAGCFVTEFEDETIQKAATVFLQGDGSRDELTAYRLVVYTVLDVTLVMLLSDGEIVPEEYLHELKYSIGPQLGLISKDISDNCLHFQQQNASTKTEDTVKEKYIYFNHKNHRFHACFYENDTASSQREGRKTSLSKSVVNLLCDLYAKEENDEDENNEALINSEKETIFKTFNDYWVVAKSYNNRSLYLILHKSSTLIDIAEESQKLLSEIVKNVYFTNQ